MEIVVGFQGKEHVTAGQVGRIIAGMAGDGTYVLDTQNRLAATVVTANQVRVDTGDLVMHGRVATVETPETLTIESGVTGQKRNDLVVARYQKELSSSVESVSLEVVKGTAVSYGTPVDPEISDGSILDGDSPVDVPLWRIPIDGLTPGTPVQLFEDTPSISELRDSVSQSLSGLSSEISRKILYSSSTGRYYVQAKSGLVWVYVAGVSLASADPWASERLSYILPAAYRPGITVQGPLQTANGASTTGAVVVNTDGSIDVKNVGSSGSTDQRFGMVVYPVGF